MPQPNDLDFSFHVWPHGWSTATLWIDSKPTEFRLTHVFNDPIESLIKSTIRLANGETSATIEWSDEPGTHILKFNVVETQRHLLSVDIAEYSRELPLHTPNDLTKTTTFFVVRDYWFHIVIAELHKISESFAHKHYRQSRDYIFPRERYNELESALQKNGT